MGWPSSSRLRCAYSRAAHTRETTNAESSSGTATPALAGAAEDGAQVAAMDVLHGDVVAAVDLSEVEDLDDVRMREAGDHLGLVDEHVHEFLVVREVGQDPLHRHDLLEPLDAAALGAEHLGHPAHRHALEQAIRPVGVGRRGAASVRVRLRRPPPPRARGWSWPPRRGRRGRSRRRRAPASLAARRPGTWSPSGPRAAGASRSRVPGGGGERRPACAAGRGFLRFSRSSTMESIPRGARAGGGGRTRRGAVARHGRQRLRARLGRGRSRLGERIEQRGDVVRQRAVFARGGQRASPCGRGRASPTLTLIGDFRALAARGAGSGPADRSRPASSSMSPKMSSDVRRSPSPGGAAGPPVLSSRPEVMEAFR